ncbi:unnamed protein product [Caenorhabditis auriculariae]|uniref:Suppressor of white apricot N-terminal domain-containing protein n=1 Tax=Caenorhabditis auriculariae TaxID=2777116 RepID=A0A8S1H2X6_9PELO|nr:unnamed protein product [Caenorhabditis auriculariae]
MWHEAKRQEKQLRARMIDTVKRNERKKKYYDNIRKDPDQFMQIHGRRSIIHTERSIAKAAEDSNILRPWMGDKDVMIDRFDARSHLDHIPSKDEIKRSTSPDPVKEKEDLVCDFERYRVLIINEFKGVSEKSYLKKIADAEFWASNAHETRKAELEKKKKSSENKANIGFSYENSETVRGRKVEPHFENESDDELPEPEDIDVDINTAEMDASAQRRMNGVGEGYGIGRSLCVSLLRADAQAQHDQQTLKNIEKQKNALAGRDAKHERMLLRKQRAAIVGKGCQDGEQGATTTLLSFIAKKNKKDSDKGRLLLQNSSSESDSDDDKKPEFITTFGGGKGSDEERERVNRFTLGPHLSRLDQQEKNPIHKLTKREKTPEFVEWGEKPSTSTTTAAKKKEPEDVKKRGRSRSKSSTSRSRSGSRDAPMWKRKRSDSERSKSDKRSSDSSSSSSDEKSASEDVKMLEIRSSMSDSEKERIEIENRKRRVKLTKKLVKENKVTAPDDGSDSEDEKAAIARKIRKKMHEKLRQTREELQRDEEKKRREAYREKRVRDELIHIEEQERCERERERRRQERKKLDEADKEGRRHRSRTRSRSRSRSRSRDRKKEHRRDRSSDHSRDRHRDRDRRDHRDRYSSRR